MADSDNGNSLKEIQNWFASVISNPNDLITAVADQVADRPNFTIENLKQVIPDGPQQTNWERMEIYSLGFAARLNECMKSYFPCTMSVVGEDGFAAMVTTYLHEFPPRSYTLGALPDRFAGFVSSLPERLAIEGSEQEGLAAADGQHEDSNKNGWEFLAELIRLEFSISKVFDGPGSEKLKDFQVPGGDSLERILDSKISLCPSLQLLQFDYPVNEFLGGFLNSDASQHHQQRNVFSGESNPRKEFVALKRSNFTVERFGLHPVEFQILQDIQAGESLASAAESIFCQIEEGGLEEFVAGCFFRWTKNRFLLAIDDRCSPTIEKCDESIES